VDEGVAADEVYAAARRRVEGFVGGPAYAIRAAKEAIDRGLEVDLDTGLEIERMQFVGVFATRDRDLGMAAFVEHQPGRAKFEGR
jgi:enoyl-CoA hydratase/carnithine racemase